MSTFTRALTLMIACLCTFTVPPFQAGSLAGNPDQWREPYPLPSGLMANKSNSVARVVDGLVDRNTPAFQTLVSHPGSIKFRAIVEKWDITSQLHREFAFKSAPTITGFPSLYVLADSSQSTCLSKGCQVMVVKVTKNNAASQGPVHINAESTLGFRFVPESITGALGLETVFPEVDLRLCGKNGVIGLTGSVSRTQSDYITAQDLQIEHLIYDVLVFWKLLSPNKYYGQEKCAELSRDTNTN